MKSILLVENDRNIFNLLHDSLQKNKFSRVTPAKNGFEALELIKAENFDLVLISLELPEMNGFMTTEKIRYHQSCKEIPIILMGPFELWDDRRKSIEAGADEFLIKPLRIGNINVDEFVNKIKTIASKKL